MPSISWAYIADRLLRYYFPVLILIPVTLTLVFSDRRVVQTNRKPVLVLCFLLIVMILTDVFDSAMSVLTEYSIWRVIVAVPGFCIRPLLLLVLLLDSLPKDANTKKRRLLLALPAIVNSAVFCTAFFSPLAFSYTADNHYNRGPLYDVVIVVSAMYLVLLGFYAITTVQRRNQRRAVVILLITMTCFIAALMETRAVVYPTPLLNQTIAIGTTLYFLIQFMATSTDTIQNMQLSLLLMQIRPHFINNSLAAIRGMIRRNPDEAAEALNHFSGYLQDSMHSILKTSLIPFSKEMELIENYLYMENTRFRGSITITRELIPVDFPVPPLTIQPLVENAVRHGLRGIQTPGELLIRTEMDAKEYRVVVIDNGCGFDTTQPPDPSREHVGLKNVRIRLELMCGGTLDIQSSPGHGTTSTVHIPMKMVGAIQPGTSTTPPSM